MNSKAGGRKGHLLWGGRFGRGPSAQTLAFTQSLDMDKRLAPHDIAGSIAHARMLGKVGLLMKGEAARLVKGLEKVGREIAAGRFRFVPTDEDIHTAVERGLEAVVGTSLAGKLHTGRSRNDQVALDLRLYMRERLDAERRMIGGVIRSLVGQAERHAGAVMPGYTHLQPAQPVSFAHHLLAYGFMLKRDAERFSDCRARLDECPLGSAALAGTSLPLDRGYVANLLGFRRVTENSLDAVSDRDAVLEYLGASAILMTHLSRLAEELVRWSSPAYGFIEMADEFCTGSSIMPQKKNPDVAELIRAKGAGRTAATLVEALTAMKGLPLAYNRDLQEVNLHLFVTVDVVEEILGILPPLLDTLEAREDKMAAACREGFLLATELADALVEAGVPFREAHRIVGGIVKACEARGTRLEDMTLPDLRRHSQKFTRSALARLDVHAAVAAKRLPGGTSPSNLQRQIKALLG